MAQSKSFFGLRKGSTKSLTFQVLNGKQITKDRVYNVKNPQTLAQMQQRALMATTITAYSKLKEICDHSFEGIEVGSKTMSEFIKINLMELSAKMPNVNVTSYKMGDYASNPFIVSNGTLTPVSMNTFVEGESPNVKSGVAFGDFGAWSSSLTFKNLAEACGLSQDGMLTIMDVSEGRLIWVRLKFTKKIMASTKALTENAVIITEMLNIDPDSVEGNTVETVDYVKIGKEDDRAKIKFYTLDQSESVTMIKSEKSEGKWKRSKAYLFSDDFGFNFDMGFSTYPINTTLLLNGGKMPSNVIKK